MRLGCAKVIAAGCAKNCLHGQQVLWQNSVSYPRGEAPRSPEPRQGACCSVCFHVLGSAQLCRPAGWQRPKPSCCHVTSGRAAFARTRLRSVLRSKLWSKLLLTAFSSPVHDPYYRVSPARFLCCFRGSQLAEPKRRHARGAPRFAALISVGVRSRAPPFVAGALPAAGFLCVRRASARGLWALGREGGGKSCDFRWRFSLASASRAGAAPRTARRAATAAISRRPRRRKPRAPLAAAVT